MMNYAAPAYSRPRDPDPQYRVTFELSKINGTKVTAIFTVRAKSSLAAVSKATLLANEIDQYSTMEFISYDRVEA